MLAAPSIDEKDNIKEVTPSLGPKVEAFKIRMPHPIADCDVIVAYQGETQGGLPHGLGRIEEDFVCFGNF